jgi:protocatechuate 3,4-dioxygenase beta subunit
VRGVDPGTWGVVIIGPGTARKTITDIKVEAGRVTDLGDIAMERGQRVSGRVLDSSGRSVPGAKITIGMPSVTNDTTMQQWFGGTFETTSDASGAYLFEGIAPVPGHKVKDQIVASHERFGASQPTELPDGDAVVDLILSPTGGVDGLIEGRIDRVGLVHAKRTNNVRPVAWAHVNAAGEFRFDTLPAGDYTLSLGALPGHVSASTTVTVVANQRTKAKITVARKRILLTVKVIGGSCQMVTLTAVGGDVPELKDTDGHQGCSQGKAEFEVPPGSYRACPDGKACVPVTVAASPPAQNVEVQAAN